MGALLPVKVGLVALLKDPIAEPWGHRHSINMSDRWRQGLKRRICSND